MKRINFHLMQRFRISKSQFNFSKIGAMAFVKGGRLLVPHLLRYWYTVGGSLTPNRVKIAYAYLNHLNRLHRNSGLPGVVKYLKVASVILQQVSSGHVLKDLTPLGVRISRDKSGLPRFLPRSQREAIRKGNKIVLKFWLTMVSIYRDLHFSGELKLGTITNTSTAKPNSRAILLHVKSFTDLFWKENEIGVLPSINTTFQMLTSGPQVATLKKDGFTGWNSEPLSVIRSYNLFHWKGNEHLLKSLMTCMSLNPNSATKSLWESMRFLKPTSVEFSIKTRGDALGKLSYKEEAAGKVRVFAMVDPWTQWTLYPLHKALFKVLSRIPMDGTFHQLKPLDRVPWGKVPIYSFDLSAATDRLPIFLQEAILGTVYGHQFSSAWKCLLVERDYKVSNPPLGASFKAFNLPRSVRYSVGQPMGALSSWAMLAITHHYIVQFCAWIAGVVPPGKRFSQYAVLGDDIIIWNKPVAETYLRWMDILGVEIGLAKSVISPKGTGLEFAKRTLVEGQDVSPIPFKEQSAAHRSTAAGLQFKRKYNMSMLEYIRFLGYGYKVDPSKPNRLVESLKIALMIPSTRADLMKIFSTDRPYIDITGHSQPVQLVRKALVELVYAELNALELASSKAMIKLSRFSLNQSFQAQYGGPSDRIRFSVSRHYTPKFLEELERIRRTAKFFLWHNKYIWLFYNSYSWRLLFGLSMEERLNSKVFIGAVTFLFEGRESLEKIQLDPIMTPCRGFSMPPSYEESITVLRLWSKWSKTMSMISKKQF